MNTGLIILIVVLVILAGVAIALFFIGKKAQKKQSEQQEMLDQYKQTMSMLIIDKKRMKISEAGLPEEVAKQVPWYGKLQKIPIVKVKVGPQIMNLIADEKIFEDLPVKKEVKATVSGLYITGVKGLHGKIKTDEPKKKKGRFRQALDSALEKAGAKPVK